MKRLMFSVLDVKSKLYSNPWFMSANGEAIRAFRDLADDPKTTVGRYPGEFELWRLGTFDDESGVVSMDAVSLGFADEFKALSKSAVPVGVSELVPGGKKP